jgi:acylphosphatase
MDPRNPDVVRQRAIVRGRVQGIGYRWTARSEARRLGVAGFVTNRADGTVEVEAEGPPDAVSEFLDWLRRGPTGAHVDAVEVEPLSPAGDEGFTIR